VETLLCGKAITITQPECVFVASAIQHAMRMHHVICDLPRTTIFFRIILKTHDLKKKVTEYKLRVLIFSKPFV
jgi:hypothetical protein